MNNYTYVDQNKLTNCFADYLHNPYHENDKILENRLEYMTNIIFHNKTNYSEIFSSCIDKAIEKDENRLYKGAILLIMLKNDNHPIFNTFPKDIFFNIMSIIEQLSLIHYETLKDNVNDHATKLYTKIEIKQLEIESKKISQQAEKLTAINDVDDCQIQ